MRHSYSGQMRHYNLGLPELTKMIVAPPVPKLNTLPSGVSTAWIALIGQLIAADQIPALLAPAPGTGST